VKDHDPVWETQREALKLLLGGGLDEIGKERWIEAAVASGWSVEEMFRRALALMEGMVAT
jgi:hypothetical protein